MSDPPVGGQPAPLLQVKGLKTGFPLQGREDGWLVVVDGVDLTLRAGETLGLIGESGSGKSMTAFSILGLVPQPGRQLGGQVLLDGEDLATKSRKELEQIRGSRIGMILQDPMASLHPMFKVEDQVGEALKVHGNASRKRVRSRVLELLRGVQIPEPEERMSEYPHELSGGMKQRVVGAAAIACSPDIVIADEPTTALDVTTQVQYLDLLSDLQERHGFAMMMITHDLGVVARVSDRIAVMYAGRVVETGSTSDIFHSPQHPYTRGLLSSFLPVDERLERLPSIEGQPPSPINWPGGCRFRPRCPEAMPVCSEYPPTFEVSSGHVSACWLADDTHD